MSSELPLSGPMVLKRSIGSEGKVATLRQNYSRPRSNSLSCTSNLPRPATVILPTASSTDPIQLQMDRMLFKALELNQPDILYFLVNQCQQIGNVANCAVPEWDVDKAKGQGLGAMTLLARACYHGQMGMAIMLISIGADINFQRGVAIRAAIANRQLELVQFLLTNGATLPPHLSGDRVSGPWHPLTVAVQAGDLELITTLLTSPASQSLGNNMLVTKHLLLHAARAGHINILQFLLDRIPNGPGNEEQTKQAGVIDAIKEAVSHHQWTVTRILLNRIDSPVKSKIQSKDLVVDQNVNGENLPSHQNLGSLSDIKSEPHYSLNFESNVSSHDIISSFEVESIDKVLNDEMNNLQDKLHVKTDEEKSLIGDKKQPEVISEDSLVDEPQVLLTDKPALDKPQMEIKFSIGKKLQSISYPSPAKPDPLVIPLSPALSIMMVS